MIIKIYREYEIKCTLGTIKDIENKFSKPFYTIIGGLDKMTTTEQIKLLYSGAKRADSSIVENDFVIACEENLGLGDLAENIEQFVLQLQYPGLSQEEVQQKIEKKLQAAASLRASIGTK